jgi:two-component system, NtrC family, sensor kinase
MKCRCAALTLGGGFGLTMAVLLAAGWIGVAGGIPAAGRTALGQLILATVLAVGLVGYVVRGLAREISRRQQAEQALRDAQEALALRVYERTTLLMQNAELEKEVARNRHHAAALKESQSLYDSLVEHLPAGVFRKDRAGRFVFVNSWFCRLKQLQPGQIIGKTPTELAAFQRAEMASDIPDMAAAAGLFLQGANHHQQIIETGQTVEADEESVAPDGTRKYFHVVKTPVYSADGAITGSQGLLLDVTARREAEAALETERQLLNSLLESSPDRLYFKDRESRIFRCSRAQARLFGLKDPDAAIGKTDFDFFTAEHAQAAFDDEQEIMRTGQPMTGKAERETHPDGRVTWALSSKMPWRDKAGNIIGTLGISSDITALKKAEEEQQAATAELVAAHQETQASELRFRTLCAAAPIGISLWDAQGKPQYINPHWLAITGLTLEENVDKGWQQVLHPEDAKATIGDWKRTATNGWQFDREFRLLTPGGKEKWVRVVVVTIRSAGKMAGRVGTMEDITKRRQSEELLRLRGVALQATANNVVITDRAGRIVWTNSAFTKDTGYTAAEVLGQKPRILRGGEYPPAFFADLWKTITNGKVWHGEFTNRRKDGAPLIESATITPVLDEAGVITHFIAVKQDITGRKAAEREHGLMQAQLNQAQKLESIGRLAAGVAHEINTPTQYIGDNTRFVQESFAQLLPVLAAPRQLLDAFRDHRLTPELVQATEAALESADVEYLSGEIPNAVRECLQGVERVAKIVQAMKEFSHPGSTEKTPVDLNRAIESTLTVARNEWKYVAELVTDFDPTLPPVHCLPGEFNQVILNLVVNAAHAIGDTLKDRDAAKGTITVSTRWDGEWVEVRIRDTGSGIPESARGKIFDPFFTTKGVGKGTGQGLAIAHSVVVDKHGGTIRFETELGQGTVFIIRMPLNAPKARAACDSDTVLTPVVPAQPEPEATT